MIHQESSESPMSGGKQLIQLQQHVEPSLPALLQALQESLNPKKGMREWSAGKLEEIKLTLGISHYFYALFLIGISSSSSSPLPNTNQLQSHQEQEPISLGIKQLALLTLKNTLNSMYAEFSLEELYDDVEIVGNGGAHPRRAIFNFHAMACLKSQLINPGLSLPESTLRGPVALIISRIAHFEWPERWEGFVEGMFTVLRGEGGVFAQSQSGTGLLGSMGADGQPLGPQGMDNSRYSPPENQLQHQGVQGAILVLRDFCRDDLTDLHFPALAPRLMPILFNIFTSSTASCSLKAGVIGIISEFIETIHMVKGEHAGVVEAYLQPLVQMWAPSMLAVIQTPTTWRTILLRTQTLKCVTKLTKAFPGETKNLSSGFLQGVWNDLAHLVIVYKRVYVDPSLVDWEESDDNGERLSPDKQKGGFFDESAFVMGGGEVINSAAVIYASLDYFQTVIGKKYVKEIFLSSLSQVISILLGFLQITCEMESSWIRDMNQFIQDDDPDSMSGHNVRIAVDQALVNLYETFGKDVLVALCGACVDLFNIGLELRKGSQPSWWKNHEAAMFALGHFSEEIVDLQTSPYNFEWVCSVVNEDMKCDALPFLQGRSLWFASQFASAIPANISVDYLRTSVDALGSNTVNEAVRVFAMKAINGFMHTLSSENILSLQPTIILHLCQVAFTAKEDVLILLLEVLIMACGIDEATTASMENVVGPVLVKVWSENGKDVFIMELIQDIFTLLARNKIAADAFQTRMFPLLLSALNPSESFDGNTAAVSLDLLAILIESVAEPLPKVYASEAFPRIIQLLLTVDDSGLLQNGQELLKVLCHRDFNGISTWSNGDRSGLDLLLDFIGKMLAPHESEASAIFLGPLITKVIQKGEQAILPFLPQLLTAIIYRLNTAKMPSFIETLVVIFCHIIQKDGQITLSLLHSINLPNETATGQARTGLDLFLNCWCECFADLQGAYEVKLSTTAMMRVLSTADVRLNSIIVKGDLVASSSKKIITRSMTKTKPLQYKMIPFPVKALGLILDEYAAQNSAATQKQKQGPYAKETKVARNIVGVEAFLAAQQESRGIEDDDEDEEEYDEGDYEDEDEGEAGFFDEGEDDQSAESDFVCDPIFLASLDTVIKSWFVELLQTRPDDLRAISSMLPRAKQDLITELSTVQAE